MKQNDILIFGNGWIGNRLQDEGVGIVTDAVVCSDMEDVEYVLNEIRPKVIINTITALRGKNVDWCEKNQEATHFANVIVPRLLAELCDRRRIKLIHFSTGCMFYGSNSGVGHREYDRYNFDGSWYVKTKIDGEWAVHSYGRNLVIRLRVPFDDRISGIGKTVFEKLMGLKVVCSEKNSYTSVPFLIEAVKHLIEIDAEGIYHVVCRGVSSSAEILRMYSEIVEEQPEVTEEISMDRLVDENAFRAPRSNCILNVDKLAKTGLKVPGVKEELHRCLHRIKQEMNANE